MQITSVALPPALVERLDEVANQSERSRSYVVRKLLETALTGPERLDALTAIADAELRAANAPRVRAPDAADIVAAASVDGQRMLDAHRAIAAGNRSMPK